ncbi:MAG: ATP-binding protein [candidate division Zixibacteria bacterium]|nr:ATP-binding protein [candidate division Zixibacteria bacterium]
MGFEQTYPSTLEAADLMLEDLGRFLAANDVMPRNAHLMTLMVSEAFTNAYLHGNQKDPDKRIIVQVRVNESEITADIIDQGKGGLKRIMSKKPAPLLAESGRGIDFIRHFSSSATFSEHEDGGMHVAIVLSRDAVSKTIHD